MHENLKGKTVQYRDKAEKQRTGIVKKVYGSRATIVLSWKRFILHKERVPWARIISVKVRHRWVPLAEFDRPKA